MEFVHDPVIRTAVTNNLIWLTLYLSAPLFGLLLAVFLSQQLRGIRIVRALFFLPFVISQVVVGLVFAWFFNADFGLFNHLLTMVSMQPLAPLDGGARYAVFAIVVAGLWPQTAYCMILYLTGLTGVRSDLVDAARIDGAQRFTLLWRVVVPQLRPVTFIAAMVCVVSALRSFDLVTIVSAGGPYNSSTVLAYYMYEQTFLSLRYGYGAAVATLLFILMASCVGLFLWRLLRQETK